MLTGRAFPVRMAWRETRGALRHFAASLVCVALGVAAVVGVGSFAASLEATLAREARALLGGDIELRSPYPLDAGAAARLDGLVAKGPRRRFPSSCTAVPTRSRPG